MTKDRFQSPFGEVPHPFSVHDQLFSDVDEARFAIRGVLRAYFGESSDDEDDYLFFRSALVRFEENPRVDLDLDHRNKIIIFVVKEPQGEAAEYIKEQIRKQIQLEFAVMASDARGRVAMSIFRSLESKAKKKLIGLEKTKDKRE